MLIYIINLFVSENFSWFHFCFGVYSGQLFIQHSGKVLKTIYNSQISLLEIESVVYLCILFSKQDDDCCKFRLWRSSAGNVGRLYIYDKLHIHNISIYILKISTFSCFERIFKSVFCRRIKCMTISLFFITFLKKV